jgi:hypothetical protein
MPCCGQARTQVRQAISNQTAKPAAVAPRPPQPPAAQQVYFNYFGRTGITVTGPTSSRVYRFVASGAPILVDARDAAALARVPNLRPVRTGQ